MSAVGVPPKSHFQPFLKRKIRSGQIQLVKSYGHYRIESHFYNFALIETFVFQLNMFQAI